jgi:hypothetical protein
MIGLMYNATRQNIKLFLLLCISLPIYGCPQNPDGNPPGNDPPVARAGADQVVEPGASVTLNGSASSDPEGDALTFSWRQTLGTTVALSSTSSAIVTFTAPETSTNLTFELTVSDGQRNSVATTNVAVQLADSSVVVDEVRQRSVTADPSVMGDFPDGWLVADAGAGLPPPPSDDLEFPEFEELFEHSQAPPVVEEDLAPGAKRTVEIPLAGPSGLAGSARWIGTLSPLTVVLTLDGTTVATGTAYHFGLDRGGSYLNAHVTTGGLATLSVTNTSDVTVKVRIVFAATASNTESD